MFAQEKNDKDLNLENEIETLLSLGYSVKDTSQILSKLFKINKNKIYKLIVEK